MSKLRQLTPQEVMFIGGETPAVYQHTAGLVLLDSSDRPGFGFEVYRRYMEQRVAGIPQFHWRLHEVPLGLDLPYWVEDENFSYDHHVRRVAVPSPGDAKALGELVSYLYCRHMDRSRPLWEVWFIEGLEGGKFAVFQKLHHCVIDGEGAAKLTEFLCDFEPGAAPRELDSAIAKARPGQVPERWRESLNVARNLGGLPLRITREIFDAVQQEIAVRLKTEGSPAKRAVAPKTIFNDDIGSDRGLVFCSLPLKAIKTVKTAFDVTVNDVLLALVGSSMRAYLLEQGELPKESLRTSIAVSLRTDKDDEFSNRVTTVTVTLATNLANPAERMRAIAAESAAAKRQAHDAHHRGPLEVVQLLPPVLVNALMRATPGAQVAGLTGINLIVSNVRASERPLYIAGARVTSMYPMSIITPGGGINVTCVSYADDVHFGVTIEPNLVPNPWLIIDGLQHALEEYLALAGKAARTPKESAPEKPRSTRRKRSTSGSKAAPGSAGPRRRRAGR